jgi:hypothetical protein
MVIAFCGQQGTRVEDERAHVAGSAIRSPSSRSASSSSATVKGPCLRSQSSRDSARASARSPLSGGCRQVAAGVTLEVYRAREP